MREGLNQYVVYRLRLDLRETRTRRHQSYQYLQEHGLKVLSDFYSQLYLAGYDPLLSPAALRSQLEKELPPGITGQALGVSDVLAITRDGITTAYYVDPGKLVTLSGFFHVSSAETAFTIGMTDCHIEGRPGLWLAAEEMWIDGRNFLLMQSQEFGKKAAYAVLDSRGRKAADDTEKGFTADTISQIRAFIKTQKQSEQNSVDDVKSDDNVSDKPKHSDSAARPPVEKPSPKPQSTRKKKKTKRRKNGILPLKDRESVLKRLKAYQEKIAKKPKKPG